MTNSSTIRLWRIDFLKLVLEGMISMNPLTAVCLALAGLSLVMQVRRPVLLARELAVVKSMSKALKDEVKPSST